MTRSPRRATPRNVTMLTTVSSARARPDVRVVPSKSVIVDQYRSVQAQPWTPRLGIQSRGFDLDHVLRSSPTQGLLGGGFRRPGVPGPHGWGTNQKRASITEGPLDSQVPDVTAGLDCSNQVDEADNEKRQYDAVRADPNRQECHPGHAACAPETHKCANIPSHQNDYLAASTKAPQPSPSKE